MADDSSDEAIDGRGTMNRGLPRKYLRHFRDSWDTHDVSTLGARGSSGNAGLKADTILLRSRHAVAPIRWSGIRCLASSSPSGKDATMTQIDERNSDFLYTDPNRPLSG